MPPIVPRRRMNTRREGGSASGGGSGDGRGPRALDGGRVAAGVLMSWAAGAETMRLFFPLLLLLLLFSG